MKRTKYIDYDYEEAYNKAASDLEESRIEQMLKEGKINSCYATKTIKAGTQFDVEIFPDFRRKKDVPQTIKKTREAQRKLNSTNARKYLIRLINTNFDKGDIWFNPTYTNDNHPDTVEQAYNNMRNYVRRINYLRKKKGLENMKCVYVIETGKKGRFHNHVIMEKGITLEEAEEKWNCGGRCRIQRAIPDEDGLSGLANYITEDPQGKRRWYASKNLKQPIIRKDHSTFKKKKINAMVMNQNSIKYEMESTYRGYAFKNAEVRYNEINSKFYIYAKMRKREPLSDKQYNKIAYQVKEYGFTIETLTLAINDRIERGAPLLSSKAVLKLLKRETSAPSYVEDILVAMFKLEGG